MKTTIEVETDIAFPFHTCWEPIKEAIARLCSRAFELSYCRKVRIYGDSQGNLMANYADSTGESISEAWAEAVLEDDDELHNYEFHFGF
jgi:hypothetical protein